MARNRASQDCIISRLVSVLLAHPSLTPVHSIGCTFILRRKMAVLGDPNTDCVRLSYLCRDGCGRANQATSLNGPWDYFSAYWLIDHWVDCRASCVLACARYCQLFPLRSCDKQRLTYFANRASRSSGRVQFWPSSLSRSTSSMPLHYTLHQVRSCFLPPPATYTHTSLLSIQH